LRQDIVRVAATDKEILMLASVRNLKTSEIELRHRLPEFECDWLVGQLRAKRGIADAACGGARRVVVEYDADLLASADLVDFLDDWGIPVAAVHAARA
jgi:hypothetical protein